MSSEQVFGDVRNLQKRSSAGYIPKKARPMSASSSSGRLPYAEHADVDVPALKKVAEKPFGSAASTTSRESDSVVAGLRTPERFIHPRKVATFSPRTTDKPFAQHVSVPVKAVEGVPPKPMQVVPGADTARPIPSTPGLEHGHIQALIKPVPKTIAPPPFGVDSPQQLAAREYLEQRLASKPKTRR